MDEDISDALADALDEAADELDDDLGGDPGGGGEDAGLVGEGDAVGEEAVDLGLGAEGVEMVVADGATVDLAGPPPLALGAGEGGGVWGVGRRWHEPEGVWVPWVLHFRAQHGAAWVHVKCACRAQEPEPLRRFPAHVAFRLRPHPTLARFGVEQERVLRVERVGLESRRSQGTEVMHLKITLLANKPLSRAILFAAYTVE